MIREWRRSQFININCQWRCAKMAYAYTAPTQLYQVDVSYGMCAYNECMNYVFSTSDNLQGRVEAYPVMQAYDSPALDDNFEVCWGSVVYFLCLCQWLLAPSQRRRDPQLTMGSAGKGFGDLCYTFKVGNTHSIPWKRARNNPGIPVNTRFQLPLSVPKQEQT